MRALVNPHRANKGTDPSFASDPAATAFHAAQDGYAPTPLRDLPALAAELGLGAVALKDESDRLGLPAFKILGASWAVERALREQPEVRTLVAASAGNHGRAVARVARTRGLACRVFLPARSAPPRRDAIAGEGAEVVIVDGGYEEAVAQARAAGDAPGALELADVGASGPARWVVDGYATLFAEIGAAVARVDVVLVPVGVGSLATAAVRFGALAGAAVVGVEPAAAACLTASLAAGRPTTIPTPGTSMAGLDCAEVSPAAWPELRDGITGTVTVDDDEARQAMRELAAAGLAIGDCGAAPLAALRALAAEPACADLRAAAGLGADSRVVLIATEGPTDPDGYREALSARR
jgi:diaminopropionate ammonia-lyase